jgi:hypothetical protein
MLPPLRGCRLVPKCFLHGCRLVPQGRHRIAWDEILSFIHKYLHFEENPLQVWHEICA